MTDEERARLWDAINSYAVACGGTPAGYVHGNVRRQQAVVEIEEVLRAALEDARAHERERLARACDERASALATRMGASDNAGEEDELWARREEARLLAERFRDMTDGGDDE